MTTSQPNTYFTSSRGRSRRRPRPAQNSKAGFRRSHHDHLPFGLVPEKEYGNVGADEYIDWFRPFAKAFHRVLADRGSVAIDIGGAWNPGVPTRHLYHFRLPIMMCEEFGSLLAQGFLLVESLEVTDACGVGHRSPHPSQGCREHDLVALENTVAEGQQPARAAAV